MRFSRRFTAAAAINAKPDIPATANTAAHNNQIIQAFRDRNRGAAPGGALTDFPNFNRFSSKHLGLFEETGR
jgi:hypothetical protein